jgi:hypothetical protein
LPAVFTVGVVLLLLGTPFIPLLSTLIWLFMLIVFVDSSVQNKSIKIGALSVVASFVQLIGYGTGFLRAWWQRCVLRKDEFEAFKNSFYK